MTGAESHQEPRTPRVLALLSEGFCPACEGRLTVEGEQPRVHLLCERCGVYWNRPFPSVLQCVMWVEHDGQRYVTQRMESVDWWEVPGFSTAIVEQLQRWRDWRFPLSG